MIIKDQSSATWNYYETTTDDGASSSRVSHLQPDDNDAQRPPSPPRHAHTIHSTPSPARRRLGLTALASTVFVVAMSAGLATFFLLYIILSQVPHVSDPTAFVVRERVVASSMVEASSLSALTVSTAISHFLSITTPIVFSLLAYRTAYLWMQAQSSPRVDEEGCLPTPLHYGLLVRILNSSSILNLGPLLGYFLPRLGRRPNPANTVPITTPRLLREAFGAAFVIYILSHAVGLADIWLHAASSVAIAESVTPAKTLPDFSMVVNSSLCDPSTGVACLRYKDHWGEPDVTRTASLVAANSTVPTEVSVITLADAKDTAILVPTGFVREWNFSASTYGARAKCYEVGSYCAEGGCPPGYLPGPAIDVGMSIAALQVPKLDSKSKIIQRGPELHDYHDLSRVMAYVGNLTVGSPTGVPASVANSVPPNPGPVLIKLRWTDFQTSRARVGADDTSNIVIPTMADDGDDEFQSRIITRVYTQCTLEFVKVRYGYNQNYEFMAYDIQKMTGEEANIASIFWSPLIWQQITPQLESNVHQECFGDYTAKGLLAMLGQELSRLAIAGASGVLMRSNATVSDANTVVQVLVGRYPHTPVYVFAGTLYVYAAFTIILFLATTACTSDVIIPSDPDGTKEKAYIQGAKPPRSYTALELAQRRLVDPATLIAEQYVWAPHTTPAQASEMSARTRTAEMFGVNQPVHEGKAAMGPERLVVGMGGPYADTGNPRFGVWRRPKRQVDSEPEMQAGYGLGAQSSIGSGDVELTEGTTLVGSTMRYHRDRDSDTGRLGLPPTYASLSRGTRSRSEGSDLTPEFLVRHGPGTGLVDTRQPESIRVDLGPQGRRRVAPEKDLTELMQIRSSVSSEGSVASTSTERTIRRSAGI